jgi:hypothetical protein
MTPIERQHYLDNAKRVAKRLIDLDSEIPGCVRMRSNPFLRDGVTEHLKAMGFRKRFLQSAEQFNMDCFLSYLPAAEALIHRVILDATLNDRRGIQCWHGSGKYIGWQEVLALADWTSETNRPAVFMINIAPFFERISDLLDPIKLVE